MIDFENFFKEVRLGKVKMMARILHGDYATAEDVVQEAFTRAIKFQYSYDEKRGPLDKWFNTILFNSLRDQQRQDRGLPQEDSELVADESSLLFDLTVEKDKIPLWIERVKNDGHRRILTLFYIQGYSSMEISQVEKQTSQTNVTTVVQRFREELARIYNDI